MPDRQIDPSRLQDEALRRWYLRSPDDLAQERQAADAQRYRDFFGDRSAADPGVSWGPLTIGRDIDPGLSPIMNIPSLDIEPGFNRVPDGSNQWRRESSIDQSSRPKAVRMPPPPLGPSDPQVRPAPMPQLWKGRGEHRLRPIPVANTPLNPDAAPSHPAPWTGPSTAKEPAFRNAGAKGSGRPQPQIDPARTDVFRPGPDGKLHPIPGWHTTGPTDFDTWSHNIDWGGVGRDLGNITSGALDFMGVGVGAHALIKGLGLEIGPDVVRGIIQRHHSLPKFMGGVAKQELTNLYHSLHQNLHGKLAVALKEAGFPRVGGKGGGTVDWAEYFRLNPQSRDEAVEILRRVTRDFDKANRTSVSRYLENELGKGGPTPTGLPK
jgi:hypothetical protein